MGRPRNPVDHSKPARGELAAFLRELQKRAGLDNAQLAQRADLHPDRVRRTLNGQTVPTDSRVVQKIIDACAGASPSARGTRFAVRGALLWTNARMEAKGLKPGRKPEVELIGSYAALVAGMEQLRMSVGNPSTRTLEEWAGPGMLPHTSLDRVLAHQKLPSRQQVTAFARAVGLDDGEVERWGTAWVRADADAKLEAVRREDELLLGIRQARSADALGGLVSAGTAPLRRPSFLEMAGWDRRRRERLRRGILIEDGGERDALAS